MQVLIEEPTFFTVSLRLLQLNSFNVFTFLTYFSVAYNLQNKKSAGPDNRTGFTLHCYISYVYDLVPYEIF